MSAALKPARSGMMFVAGSDGSRGTGIQELARVALKEALRTDDGETLPAGLVGTVVGIWGEGSGFDVEFTSPVAALVTVGPDAIRPV